MEKTVTESNSATNSKFPSYPPTNLLGNYICARPDKSNPQNIQHAEKILLGRFETLITSYKENNHHECRIIILYTWLLPCPGCTDKIIATLGSPGRYDKCRTILAYTTPFNYDKMGFSYGVNMGQRKRNIENKLKRAGIEVFQTERTML